MTTYTTDQALTNWRNAFDSGHLTAARAWWAIVQRSLTAIPDGTPDDDYSDVPAGPSEPTRTRRAGGGIWTGRAA